MFLLYIAQRSIFVDVALYSEKFYYTSLQDFELSGANVTPTSQIRVSTMSYWLLETEYHGI
jgi:hypothetical protein